MSETAIWNLTELLRSYEEKKGHGAVKLTDALVAIRNAGIAATAAQEACQRLAESRLLVNDARDEAERAARKLLDQAVMLHEVFALLTYLDASDRSVTTKERRMANDGCQRGLLAHHEQQLLRTIVVEALAGEPDPQ